MEAWKVYVMDYDEIWNNKYLIDSEITQREDRRLNQ